MDHYHIVRFALRSHQRTFPQALITNQSSVTPENIFEKKDSTLNYYYYQTTINSGALNLMTCYSNHWSGVMKDKDKG